MKLPYFLALFQGEGLIINTKVNRLSASPKKPHGYMEIIWIKRKEKEWLINLQKQTIECKNGARKFCRTAKFQRKIKPVAASNNRKDHSRYFINTALGDILAISYKRQLYPHFNKKFFKKYGNFENCYGALISKEKVRYLNSLREIII